MAVTNYYTIDGQMIGYKDTNGRKDFLTDNLGSVTGEIDQTGTNRTFDGRYRPYGNSLWSTGTRGAFGWIGTWGYRVTGLNASTHYVRARHYSQSSGEWTSADHIWPLELAYAYLNGSVTSFNDPSGLSNCAFRAQSVPGMGIPVKGSKKPPSKMSNFIKCQQYLEWANQTVGAAGLSLICPGGKQEICEECSKASGLPMNCGGYPKCDSSGHDILPPKVTPDIEGLVMGALSFPFGNGMNLKMRTCMAACTLSCISVGGKYPKYDDELCDVLCKAVSSGKDGCDNLFRKCMAYEKEYYRRNVCMSFYLGVCFGK